jgi:hypothetical protein
VGINNFFSETFFKAKEGTEMKKSLAWVKVVLKKILGLRVRVWVILDLFEHTREDFQPQVLLVS